MGNNEKRMKGNGEKILVGAEDIRQEDYTLLW